MANPEHLAKLDKGVSTWNKWRSEHDDVTPDLVGLTRVCADFTLANLAGANLSGSNLLGTILHGANLCRANLAGAILSDANLFGAQLALAILLDANLSGAILTQAGLYNSDMSRATIGTTSFGDNDLSSVKGLDSVHHAGPSTIGIDTIYRSGGKIPEVFLLGAGVPEGFITYMRSLVANPIEFYSCFISYSGTDQEFAEELHARLRAQSVRCWFAPENLRIGDRFQDRIEESIRVYDKLVVVLSKNSVSSLWVEREVNAALEKEAKQGRKEALFPIRLDDSISVSAQPWAAEIRRTRYIGDFSKWKDHDSFQKSFDRLLRDLKSKDPRINGD